MRLATGTVVRSLGDWLGFAAAPTFAVMALLAAGGDADICSSIQGASRQGASLLNGMSSMYLLMSVFHLAPWLKLISARREAPAADPALPRITPPT
ncbi:hypothetical protein ACLMJV_07735 [Sinorhizobium meliloti]|uniref:hypothetical protein n=1 Tax=Sinorhizobium TaxID=28105 RepID=UPI00294A4B68|nr:hypothetical protein KGO5_01101 [Sinorhizobium sp. KGO-5]